MTAESAWPGELFETLARAEEIRIETLRPDGAFRRPVPIWIVPVGEDLYVRSSHGRESAWFRGALSRHRARVRAEAASALVRLVEVDGLEDALDAAYARKYRRYARSFLPALVAAPAQAAALRLEPAEA